MSQENQRIVEFLTTNTIGVLATSDLSNQPHAATMYFVVDSDMNVYFITKEETTKCHNLEQNPKAAISVYEPATQSTVQITGTVTAIEEASLIEDIYRRVLATVAATSESAVPPLSKISGGRYRFFRLIPQTAHLAQYTKPSQGAFVGLFDEVVLPPSARQPSMGDGDSSG